MVLINSKFLHRNFENLKPSNYNFADNEIKSLIMPFLKPYVIHRSQKLGNLAKKNGTHHEFFTISNNKYKGQWRNNKKEGQGSYVTRTNQRYDGSWKADYRDGFGVLSHFEDLLQTLNYRGEWRKGKAYGFGERHYLDGSYYRGSFHNGKRHGYGEMWYADGAFYVGDWSKDERDGVGMLVMKQGNRYEGKWSKDMKHGEGIYFHLDSGQMQEGYWKEDVCRCSVIRDLAFRQTATTPSKFPLRPLKTVNQGMYEDQLAKIIKEEESSCLIIIKESESDLSNQLSLNESNTRSK